MYTKIVKKQGYHLEILLPILKKKEAFTVNGDGSGNGNGIRVAIDNQQQQLGNGDSHFNQKSTQELTNFLAKVRLLEIWLSN